MTTKNKPTWYIEPLDAFTNHTIYQALTEIDKPAEISKITDAKGIRHEVWETDYPFIKYLRESERFLPAKFNVFIKIGDIVRQWKLLIKKDSQKKKGGRDGSKRRKTYSSS